MMNITLIHPCLGMQTLAHNLECFFLLAFHFKRYIHIFMHRFEQTFHILICNVYQRQNYTFSSTVNM